MADRNLRVYAAELVGTFALVFLSAGAVCANGQQEVGAGGLVAIALASGLIYAAALAFTLPLSGGYLNPALTVMLWVFRRVDGKRATALVGVQLLGAALAGAALRLLLSFKEDIARVTHLGTPHIAVDLLGVPGLAPRLKGIGIELILTFVLTIVAFGMTLDPRTVRRSERWPHRLAALWIGLVLVADTLVGYVFTGAAVNPARWFGPAMWEATIPAADAFADHVVYWLGPTAGALLGGWLYTALILPPEGEVAPTAPPSATASAGLARARK